jgi:hypothetical protein
MLEITTNKQKSQKKILMDGYTYMVRRPGAGEALTLNQISKDMTKYKNRTDLAEDKQSRLQEMSMRALEIALGFFDPLGDEEANKHLQSIDVEEIMSVITQVFSDTSEA